MTATEVSEVWLYGSTARGDDDATSDVDLLVVGSDDVDVAFLELPRRDRVSTSRYSWDELEHMAKYGSLFLHHVKHEGRPVVETDGRRLRSILETLPDYSRADLELRCFRSVLDDVELALQRDHSVQFELSVIATAARHAAILGCYLIGKPTFGRASAFATLLPRLGYSETFVEEVIALYAFRRADDCGRPVQASVTASDVSEWVVKVRGLIDDVTELSK